MKKSVIKSKRLVLTPMTKEELEEKTNSTENPEHRSWHTAWKIVLKGSNAMIGEVGFKGPVSSYCVEIGYGIEKRFEGNGYATEAVKAITEWGLSNDDVYFVEAETEPDNKASQCVLEKNGFVRDGEGEEGPRYVKEKAHTYWMPIYMCLGLSIGLSMGSAQGNVGAGMSMGLCIGMMLGAGLDSTMKKKREKAREARNKRPSE